MSTPPALDASALRVYETLLQHPGLPADALADTAGVPRQALAPAVEALRSGGLVTGPLSALAAAPPDVAVEELLAAHYARMAEESARIAQIRRQLTTFSEVRNQARSADSPFEVVHGLDGIQRSLAELTVRCRRELLCMVPTAGPSLADASAPLMRTNRDAAARGVSLRTLVPDAVADEREGWEYARALIEIGDLVRTCSSIALIVNIFDARTAMVPVDTERPREGAFVVTHETLVAGLVALFENLWATSLPITAHGPNDPLDARDRQILELLLRGAKDEQVARTIGVSVRTVRAHVAALTERAGARSRFQLAAVALHHGWISAA